MNLRDFWYVAAESRALRRGAVAARVILGEHLVLFRDRAGNAVALEDRCVHRNAPLSIGKLRDGTLVCGYHGWRYDGDGRVIEIPSLVESGPPHSRCAKRFDVREREGYVYVRLEAKPDEEHAPFAMPMFGAPGWSRVRLVNAMANDVTNCAENFVDVPHTAYVHPRTFRAPRRRVLQADIVRENGAVTVTYRDEVHRGAFAWFLNPGGRAVEHVDRFVMPNITSVEYRFGPRRRLFITSQSVPAGAMETLVYTDIAFDYGVWNALARPFVARRARRIIAEDVAVLAAQGEVIARAGRSFSHSPIDQVHIFIEQIRGELENGRDPRRLERQARTVAFTV
jgi:phenylpropionate dioxygenase-like ring-hydroxylating dioxygenase large terminal subunit